MLCTWNKQAAVALNNMSKQAASPLSSVCSLVKVSYLLLLVIECVYLDAFLYDSLGMFRDEAGKRTVTYVQI